MLGGERKLLMIILIHYTLLPSGRRFNLPTANGNVYKKSFVADAAKAINKTGICVWDSVCKQIYLFTVILLILELFDMTCIA